MNLVDLTTKLVDYLRGTITSPHAIGVNWIYSDYPRYDATFPRISITQIAGSLTEIGIGSRVDSTTGRLCTIDYDIDVWVKVEDRTVISTVTYVGTKLRDYYANSIIKELQKARSYFKTSHSVLDIEILSIASVPLDEEHNLHRKTIGIRCSFIMEDT